MVRPDPRFALVVGTVAVLAGALAVVLAVLYAPSLGDGAPPTSWRHGDGDTVVVVP